MNYYFTNKIIDSKRTINTFQHLIYKLMLYIYDYYYCCCNKYYY